MKKKILVLLLALLIVFSCTACGDDSEKKNTTGKKYKSYTASVSSNEEKRDETVSTPYFWKVTGKGFDGDFYLLGSIHIGDENTNKYPKEITDAYDNCEYLAVESDVIAAESDYNMQYRLLQAMMYSDGSTISDHIDKNIYEMAKELLEENGTYNSAFDMLKPFFWVSLIEEVFVSKSDYSMELGVDRYFLQKAKDDGKTVLEVEDPIGRYDGLLSLSTKTEEYLLKQYLMPGALDVYLKETKELYSVWKKGDIRGHEDIMEVSTDEMSEEELEMYLEYNEAMLGTRNEDMIDAALSYLENDQDVFYIVGLAHMLGEDSIVEGLRNKGYTVTQVRYN